MSEPQATPFDVRTADLSLGAAFVHVVIVGPVPDTRVAAEARPHLDRYQRGLARVRSQPEVVTVPSPDGDVGAGLQALDAVLRGSA